MDKVKLKEELDSKQKEIDKLYSEQGLTDEVLNKQIEINKLRHEHDIPDESQFIYGEYSQ